MCEVDQAEEEDCPEQGAQLCEHTIHQEGQILACLVGMQLKCDANFGVRCSSIHNHIHRNLCGGDRGE